MLKITAVALALGSAYASPITSTGPVVDVDDEIEIVPFDATRRLNRESAMEKLRQMKAVHRGAKARCKATGNEKACAKQARLEESMIALSAKWREPAREDAGRRLESEDEERAKAMEKLQRLKKQHKKAKRKCKKTGDAKKCAKQQRLEEQMLELSAKYREPAREDPAEEPEAPKSEEELRAEAMETLRQLKEEHATVKAACKRSGDADTCALQASLEEAMIALSAEWREPARKNPAEEPEAPKSEEEQRAEAMEKLRQLKEQHTRVKAACKRSGDSDTCLLQARLEEAMLALSAEWREPAREGPKSEEDERAEAMEQLRQMKATHQEVKALCKASGDATACDEQQRLEEAMIALSAKWREPAREGPESEEGERAQAMEELRQMKAIHKEVKADCLETGDALLCAEQARLEERMIALSGEWREDAREAPSAEDERAQAMEDLREMKAAHKEVKAYCLKTGDEDACAEQADLEAEMIRLSGIYREPAREAGRRLEESAKKAEKRANAMEKLRKMKATHKIAKAACKKTGKEKVCAKQQRLEEKMIALSGKWRKPSRN